MEATVRVSRFRISETLCWKYATHDKILWKSGWFHAVSSHYTTTEVCLRSTLTHKSMYSRSRSMPHMHQTCISQDVPNKRPFLKSGFESLPGNLLPLLSFPQLFRSRSALCFLVFWSTWAIGWCLNRRSLSPRSPIHHSAGSSARLVPESQQRCE